MRWREGVARSSQRARQFLVTHRRVLALGLTLFAAAIVAFRVARRAAGFWTIDDAGITYAASFELADHGSLAPYVEGCPVEGFSNPLLFFAVTVLRLIGVFDPITTHILIETLMFGAMVMLVWSLLRSVTGDLAATASAVLFATIELVTPSTWVWYGSGLENVWVSTGIVALLWICARSARGAAVSPAWGIVPFLVAITRPEAPVYVAAFYLALFTFGRPTDIDIWVHARRVARALVVTSALYLIFLCWRRVSYGDWLPNTYYAKLNENRHLARHVREYVFPVSLPYCHAAL